MTKDELIGRLDKIAEYGDDFIKRRIEELIKGIQEGMDSFDTTKCFVVSKETIEKLLISDSQVPSRDGFINSYHLIISVGYKHTSDQIYLGGEYLNKKMKERAVEEIILFLKGNK